MRSPRHLLSFGIAVPILYLLALVLGSAFYPGYSHVTRYASELGAAEAPHPWIFNSGIVAAGLAAALAGPGLFHALRRLGSDRLPAVLSGVAVSLWGVAMVLGGSFPMPDPRHGGFGLGLGLQVAPLFLLRGLRRTPDSGRLRIFLVVVFLAMTALFAVMMGVGGLVTRANVGLWQRGNALASIPWIGIAAYALRRRLAH
ncbi:MAG: DUF998 domain-containing protein [Thermoanaerobaculia bacterium]|nr:DUF998 domain-containing protein [Thermoanaerobaculia bacterium]